MNRLGFIGGSDVGVILGLSKYKTRLELYYEKTGLIPVSEEMSLPIVTGKHQ